jgi:phosphatidylserine/phosphatidylglycerophosphate/cardiolipin synthase-like enzyme
MRTEIVFHDEIRRTVYNLLSVGKGFRRVRVLTLNMAEAYLQDGLTLSRMISRLCATNARVVVVLGDRPDKKDLPFFKRLSDWGVRIFYSKKLHAKVMISEAREKKTELLITSANFTTTGLHYNYEAGVWLSDVDGPSYQRFNSYVNGIIGSARPLVVEVDGMV